MKPQELIDLALQKPGAYEDYPFGPDSVVIKVRKRIFAQIFTLHGVDSATLNCDAMTGQFYRDLFPDVIVCGYHCPPVQQPYFNTFPLDGRVPDDMILEMLDHSYETVIAKLPKYMQRELMDEEKNRRD